MGGKVLEYEAKTILNQGRAEGRAEGKLEMAKELYKKRCFHSHDRRRG